MAASAAACLLSASASLLVAAAWAATAASIAQFMASSISSRTLVYSSRRAGDSSFDRYCGWQISSGLSEDLAA